MKTLVIDAPGSTVIKSANLVSLFIISFLATAFGGAVSTLMSVYLPVVVKDLQVAKNLAELANISGYINSVFIFGWAAGGFLWGLISDKTGRKAALLSAIACYGIFTILTGLMPGWSGVIICRVFERFWSRRRFSGFSSFTYRSLARTQQGCIYWHYIYRLSNWDIFRRGDQFFCRFMAAGIFYRDNPCSHSYSRHLDDKRIGYVADTPVWEIQCI